VIKKILLGFLAIIFLLGGTSFGQANKYGLGLIIFDPTGLTVKTWLKKSGAIDGAVGWSAMEGHQLHIHADYLFYGVRIASDQNVEFSFYLGVGGKIIFQDHDSAWFRVPLGIDFFTKKSPLNIFIEIVPSFNFNEIDLYGAIGIRYLFTR
jgi:hypothetical protein